MRIARHNIIRRLNRLLLYFGITVSLAFFMGPFYWIVISSIQEQSQLYSKTPNFIPRSITLQNYISTLLGTKIEGGVSVATANISRALSNSLIVAVITTIICIGLGIFTAYVFARLKFRGSNFIFVSIIITEMLPPVALLIPFYILFKRLLLLNNLLGLVIVHSSWLLPVVTWVLFSYFRTIPTDLEDSARIDGCSRVGAIFRVIVPVAVPGIASSAIMCFIFSMGEFMTAMTLLNQDKVRTLPVVLSVFVGKFAIDYGRVTAGAILAIIFPVLFVLFFQRFIIKGLTAGAIKE